MIDESQTMCDISLRRNRWIPGDIVRGSVEYLTNRNDEVVSLKISAKEKVHWTEATTFYVQGFAQTQIEDLKGETKLVDTTIILPKGDSWRPGMKVSIPFSFTLPEGLPGTSSHITYKLKAQLSSSGTSCSAPFTVLQKPPRLGRLQVSSEASVKFMACCDTGNVRCKFVLDRGVYSPGEEVELAHSIQNRTKADVTEVCIALKSVSELISSDNYNKAEEVVVSEHVFKWRLNELRFTLPPTLAQCTFGKNHRMFYLLDIHVNLSRGTGPTLRLPLLVMSPEPPAEELPLPETGIVNILVPQPPTGKPFDISSFRNVSEYLISSRSSGRLSGSWAQVRSMVRRGSRFFTGDKS